LAKYERIREVLLERIASGAWPPGSAIPFEADLAEEFGVTRPTVSRAMRDLVDGGLVERRRRAGSRVAMKASAASLLRIPVVRDEVEGRGGTYGHLLLERRLAVPPAAVRACFGSGAADKALHLASLHLDDGRPCQFEDRWIDLAVLPAAATQDFAAVSANEWLVRQVAYTRAEHVLSAAGAAAAEAEALQVAPGAPVFVIERTTWSGEDAITRVRLVHPAESFRIVARNGVPGGGQAELTG
jgi:GntR family histidine utilization transcriptional repressor